MTTLNRVQAHAGFPAFAAAVGFLGIAGLRIGSAIVVAVYLLAALIVLGRAGAAVVELPRTLVRWGIWFLVILPFGALMKFASPSNWERYLWGPSIDVGNPLLPRNPRRAIGGRPHADGPEDVPA